MEDDWSWTYFKDEAHGQVYISTQTGMLLYTIKTHKLQKLTAPSFDDHRPVSSFVPCDDGTVWMSHYRNDFMKYNTGNKTFRRYSLADLGEKPSVLRLHKDNSGQLWLIHNETGLLRFDEETGKITEKILVKPGDKTGLLEEAIIAVYNLGIEMFIGYGVKGFSLYNRNTKTFRHFSQWEGLASNTVTDAISTCGQIWIATTNGLSRFDTATKKFITYNFNSGILENDFLCVTKLPDGRIAAGSTRGLVLFNPDLLDNTKNIPPPMITAINLYGKPISPDSLQSANLPLHASHKENYFSIDYISPLFSNNQHVEYAYKLQGVNQDWIPAGNRRFVSYTNLKGGTYYFKIRARLPGREWVESAYILPVIVNEAFYSQWWFYVLLALAFAGLVYSLYRYRLQQYIRMERMRTAISSDLHDEVGATLSSISIFSEMAKNAIDSPSKAGPYLQRIGERSRESIEKMGDIIWIELYTDHKYIKLWVKDDGIGFNTHESQTGNGIKNMQYRSQLLHGKTEITSNENGTSVSLCFPH